MDAGVAALKKIQTQIKRYRQAVLKAAFEGKLTEDWRKKNQPAETGAQLLERIREERKKKLGSKYKEPAPIGTSELPELPDGWVWRRIDDVTDINPKLPFESIAEDEEVSFLPMKLVEEENNIIYLTEVRKYQEVKKGYTPFTDGDVIFAKITPCMENGKIAIVNNLKNAIGFGSTEFHVFRCSELIKNEFLFYYFIQQRFRDEAAHNMFGAVGQKRAPKKYLEAYLIPLPGIDEQIRIVFEIKRLFSVVDAIEKTVEESLAQSERLRQSILKKAFEGKLVPQDPSDPPASELLEQIRKERALVKVTKTKTKSKGFRRAGNTRK